MPIKIRIFLLVILVVILNQLIFSQTGKKSVRVISTNGKITVQKLDTLNSKYPELNLSITPDGKYLYFMSSRPTSFSTKNYTGRADTYDGDIYYSKNENDSWGKPVCLDRTINSSQGEDEPNVSPDGQVVYFQSWKTGWENSGGPYYTAKRKGDSWLSPKGLGSGITQFFLDKRNDSLGLATDGATFSPDGKKFVLSYGRGYYENMDLYISTKDELGNWQKPKKLSVSTPFNERNPFLAADGKTLYFSSNGYNGFGKMDVYKTTINDDGTCGEVVNLGKPFNTNQDDQSFVLTSNGDDLFFVRDGDIYYSDLKNIISEIKPNPTVIVYGKVSDKKTGKFIEAEIKMVDGNSGEEVGMSHSNSKNGEYSLVGKLNTKYSFEVSSPGYESVSKELEVPQELTSERLAMDFSLEKEEVPEPEKPVKEVVQQEPPQEEPVAEPCISKLEGKILSAGLCPLYPFAVGIKTEAHYGNFGGMLIYTYLPKVGRYDDTKPPDDLANDNYSTSLMISLVYNYPLSCSFYPFIGLYTGYQFRNWKKPILENGVESIKEGSYSGNHWGVSFGLKVFLNDDFYLEGGGGVGKNGIHSIPSGDIIDHEWQFIPWFSICYLFQ